MIELPAEKPLRVTVYSKEPALLKPLIASNPQVEATFWSPSDIRSGGEGDIVILDRFAPPVRPKARLDLSEPPASGSPIPVKAGPDAMKLERGDRTFLWARACRQKICSSNQRRRLSHSPGDIVVAESAQGALIVARPNTRAPKIVVIGFHPLKIVDEI